MVTGAGRAGMVTAQSSLHLRCVGAMTSPGRETHRSGEEDRTWLAWTVVGGPALDRQLAEAATRATDASTTNDGSASTLKRV